MMKRIVSEGLTVLNKAKLRKKTKIKLKNTISSDFLEKVVLDKST